LASPIQLPCRGAYGTVGRINLGEDFVRFIHRRNFFKYIIAFLFFLSTQMERNTF
jgi:hypothetical protein